MAGRDERDLHAGIHHDLLRDAPPGDPCRGAAETPPGALARELEAVGGMRGGHAQRTGRHVEAGLGEEPGAHHGLGQRQRDGEAAGGAHDDVGVLPSAASAPVRLRDLRKREPVLLHLLPQAGRPHPLLGGFAQLRGESIGEEPVHRVGQDGLQLVHVPISS